MGPPREKEAQSAKEMMLRPYWGLSLGGFGGTLVTRTENSLGASLWDPTRLQAQHWGPQQSAQ